MRYKKPVIPLLFDPDAEMPFLLEPRQYLDFAADDKPALATLRDHICWRSSPEGLQGVEERLFDAERDLPRAKGRTPAPSTPQVEARIDAAAAALPHGRTVLTADRS